MYVADVKIKCYTSGKVLCAHLQVPCPFSSHPSQCRELHGCEDVVCKKSLAALNLNVHAPRDCHLLPSRARHSPGRDIMLLRCCSRNHLVSDGITGTYVRCTLKIGMAFFILLRKFIVPLKMLKIV